MNYRWHPEALEDLEDATRFYFEEDPSVEVRFSALLDEAIEQVTKDPLTWPMLERDVLRYLVHIFPYSLFYSIEKDHILILAVAHQSRNRTIGNIESDRDHSV